MQRTNVNIIKLQAQIQRPSDSKLCKNEYYLLAYWLIHLKTKFKNQI